jgi:hypothetical protein
MQVSGGGLGEAARHVSCPETVSSCRIRPQARRARFRTWSLAMSANGRLWTSNRLAGRSALSQTTRPWGSRLLRCFNLRRLGPSEQPRGVGLSRQRR